MNQRIRQELAKITGTEVIFLENFSPELLAEADAQHLAQKVQHCQNVPYLFDLLDKVKSHITKITENSMFLDYKEIHMPTISRLERFSTMLINRINDLGPQVLKVPHLTFTTYEGLDLIHELDLDENTRYVYFHKNSPQSLIEKLYLEITYRLSSHTAEIIHNKFEGNHFEFLKQIAKRNINNGEICILERTADLSQLLEA